MIYPLITVNPAFYLLFIAMLSLAIGSGWTGFFLTGGSSSRRETVGMVRVTVFHVSVGRVTVGARFYSAVGLPGERYASWAMQ